MTNYERIKNMSVEEMVEFLSDISQKGNESKPFERFDKKYCNVCPTVEVVWNNRTEQWHECEFEAICPHYSNDRDLIKLYLESEVDGK